MKGLLGSNGNQSLLFAGEFNVWYNVMDEKNVCKKKKKRFIHFLIVEGNIVHSDSAVMWV